MGSRAFVALVICLFLGGPGIFSTLNPAAFKALVTSPLTEYVVSISLSYRVS